MTPASVTPASARLLRVRGEEAEAALQTAVALLAHLGMVFVPMGYEKLSAVTTTRAPKCLLLSIDVSWSMLFGKVDMKPNGRGPDGGRWLRDDDREFSGGDVDRS